MQERTCRRDGCMNALGPNPRQRWCCKRCNDIARGKTSAEVGPRVCPICDTTFHPSTNNNVRFCGARCGKRAENAKQRGQDPRALALPAPYDCARCGKRCVPGENVVAHASRFCSPDCKKRQHTQDDPTGWHAKRAADRLVASFTEQRKRDETAYQRAMRRDPCAYCGAASTDLDHIEAKELGGADGWENRAGTCSSCNQSKWVMSMLLFLGYQQAREAFAPWQAMSKRLRCDHAQAA
jgi:hypothetical protein